MCFGMKGMDFVCPVLKDDKAICNLGYACDGCPHLPRGETL